MNDHDDVFALGCCGACGRKFTFNPYRVPSIRLRGYREPVCRDCIVEANEVRQGRGLPLFPVLDGAYEPEPVH